VGAKTLAYDGRPLSTEEAKPTTFETLSASSRRTGQLELAPIGRASECKRAWLARSFGELLKLPEAKERLHARCATIHHRARLGAV
jgi:hypothetical protein